jgi:plasmid maintenance system killer protein/DNA-binding XRE family transcriptional regulator
MWQILEYRELEKAARRIPSEIWEKYDVWKGLVHRHGPEILRQFPGYHDEKLRGDREGQRSSRLNLQYRVIYAVDRSVVTVYVLEIIPHKY